MSSSFITRLITGWPDPKETRFLEWFVTFGMIVGWWIFWHRYGQRNLKGPKTWPLLGCIVEQAKNFDKLHDWLLNYFQSTSTFSVPMMTINNTFTIDPANVEHILKTNFHNYPKGEKIHERFCDMMGDGIFVADGELWRQQRKVAVLEFSSAKLRDFSIYEFREKALKLVEILSILAKKGQEIELQDIFMRLTFDSICKIGFGLELGSLSPTLPTIPFAIAFDEGNRLIVRRYVDMFWKIKRALNLGRELRLKKCIEVMDSFLYKVIEKRRSELQATSRLGQEETRADLLSRFLSLENEDKLPYTNKQLRDIVINFIVAGRDTTAVTLSWFFSMLCKNPHVISTILLEVDNVLGDITHAQTEEEISTQVLEFAQLLNYEALNRMHYLHAAISETLRLFPAVPLETKIAASDDILPDGTRLKQGNFVSYVPYAMGRLPCIWGPDAHEFRPERWLKDGIFQPQSPFKLTAFQAGPRMCLGKDSAFLQMKMTTVLLLRFFKFKLAEGHCLDYSMTVVLYMAGGLNTTVSLR